MTNFYILIILVIPIVVIFTSNLLIIIKTRKADLNRKDFVKNIPIIKKDSVVSHQTLDVNLAQFSNQFYTRRNALTISKFNFRFKPLYQNVSQLTNKNKKAKSNASNKMSKMLILVSFSYALLNLPYLVTWCLFYTEIALTKTLENNSVLQNYLFGAVQIAEVFYILNYGLHFYFYCFTGSKFFNQLKLLSKFSIFFFI